jgi:sporulation protein YlmC with PRC-barrel domain
MNKPLFIAAAVALMSTTALAQSGQMGQTGQGQTAQTAQTGQPLTRIPANSTTVTNYYKQTIYDSANNKLGEVSDVLVDRDGRVTALIVGVGGVAGAGEKDVAVPFSSVRLTTQDNKTWRLVMNSNEGALKSAPGYKYDRSTTTWTPQSQ